MTKHVLVSYTNFVKRKQVGATILAATDGLVGTVTNLVLLQLYFLASVGGVKTMGDASRVANDVHRMFDAVNYKTIKAAIYQLTKGGLVARPAKYSRFALTITEFGRKRIAELIPTYKKDRPWDGHIYLVSYDIPKRNNRSRDLLREYIRRTGGALLQESLWINPYNPTLLLETFARDHEIPGTILVSKLGSDGAIGDETLPDLIARVYTLGELGRRYEEFLETGRHPIEYLAILKDDPQLPFALLPKDFPAEAAFARYQNLLGKS